LRSFKQVLQPPLNQQAQNAEIARTNPILFSSSESLRISSQLRHLGSATIETFSEHAVLQPIENDIEDSDAVFGRWKGLRSWLGANDSE
jgi:hypothetical protein